MTIEELVEKGLLKKVCVQKPPADVKNAGDKRFADELGISEYDVALQAMHPGYCQSNSICIVAEMRDKGEDDWDIVPGFAYDTGKEDPVVHVWVRERSLHYDPTWSLPLLNYDLEDCRYYQVVQNIESTQWEQKKLKKIGIGPWGRAILNEIEALAKKWRIELAEKADGLRVGPR